MALLRSVANIALGLCFFAVIVQCKRPEQKIVQQTERGEALGTTYTIIYEVPSDTVFYTSKIAQVFDEVNASMSTYIPDSDISRINRGDTAVVVDAYFEEVFASAREVWQSTNGVFDPTVGALVNAWGFGPEKGIATLDSAQVDSILVFTGLEKIAIDESNKVVKNHPQVYLDFNALAKGYCVDLVGRMLEEQGVENYLVEIGGEILAKGKNTIKDKQWVVAVDDPFQPAGERRLIAKLALHDRAMATSGNYRKYRVDEVTGEKYVHTIDPRTGYPFKNKVLSASVLAPTCMEADAYATAFMGMSLEGIKETLNGLEHLDVYIISLNDQGGLQEYRTSGFQRLMLGD
ncbi:FAD:protein FMN transferase [Robertkochia sediminum]|uniref:FAD:protein FMN transferase n=1 Tax=Robertkochia sediminum TaxID=2785326 RepID=UPI0019333F2C|nr:FAD:protein FMN transferase [Robertkochia sediminum]MBL7471699.1 FAD:protein FMN transferase [Robertkochia sediminum]